jgi:hypothetical protein
VNSVKNSQSVVREDRRALLRKYARRSWPVVVEALAWPGARCISSRLAQFSSVRAMNVARIECAENPAATRSPARTSAASVHPIRVDRPAIAGDKPASPHRQEERTIEILAVTGGREVTDPELLADLQHVDKAAENGRAQRADRKAGRYSTTAMKNRFGTSLTAVGLPGEPARPRGHGAAGGTTGGRVKTRKYW